MEALLHFDARLFFHINGQWHNAFLDAVLPFVRNQYFWAPFYLFLLVFMPLNFQRRGFYWILFFLIGFACTDYISSSIIKPLVARPRPCNDPFVAHFTRLLVDCGSGKSFPSSHAANHFGMAAFMYFTLRKDLGKWCWVFFIWAFLIAYAQLYVGVHYPLDIVVGTLLGLLVGSKVANIFNRKIRLSAII